MNTMTTTPTPTPTPAIRSPWHSPVPYLFGGLAAMLGLIAFALLILACSYWRLSNRLGDNNDSSNRDLEAGSDEKPKCPPRCEEKFLVIMAGQNTPTFLATPVSSTCSYLKSSCNGDEAAVKVDSVNEEKIMEAQLGNSDTHETSS